MECFFNLVPTTGITTLTSPWNSLEIPWKSDENSIEICSCQVTIDSRSRWTATRWRFRGYAAWPPTAGGSRLEGRRMSARGGGWGPNHRRLTTCGKMGGNIGGSINGGIPKIMVYNMKIPFRWMIWGYAHVRKPPNDEQMVVECQLYHLQLALVMILSYIIYCRGWYLLFFFAIEHQSHSVIAIYHHVLPRNMELNMINVECGQNNAINHPWLGMV